MNKIKYFRKQKKITVKALAEKADVATGYLSSLENEKSNNPSKSIMLKISTALEQTVPEVFFPKDCHREGRRNRC